MARVYCENQGEKLFWHISILKILSKVSIPLRGKGYEKPEATIGKKVMKILRFHPLAGKRL
ncbi:hypothetical protein [Sphaerospermopsis torques-reginae]|uniref:Transposase n=1 Tax=Sphaerospermopsis torques-reginae ITEP-024 TaxID=984208 RepID=A0ABX8WTS6_9CYAN|nr:hypothetical protein [Sphaerospermopsis torques-reginae]QYX29783.1 hypothetical protein K2F26_12345 [Sphaerospermopsis torques-reginae ITEP-024]